MSDFGFDFRSSSGFVSDPANCTYVVQADSYPQTRNGITFGWTVAPTGGSFDDNAGGDARLAGAARDNNTASRTTLRIDLPAAGNWTLDLALGRNASGTTNNKFRVLDNTTELLNYAGGAPGADQYYDANNVLRTTGADWVANHVTVVVNFATTTCFIEVGVNGAGETQLAHVRLTQSGGPPPSGPSIFVPL